MPELVQLSIFGGYSYAQKEPKISEYKELMPEAVLNAIEMLGEEIKLELINMYLSPNKPKLENKEDLKCMTIKENMEIIEEMARGSYLGIMREIMDSIKKHSYSIVVQRAIDPYYHARDKDNSISNVYSH